MTRAHLDKAPQDVASMFDTVAEKYDLTNSVLTVGIDRVWRRATQRAGGHRHQLRTLRRRGRSHRAG